MIHWDHAPSIYGYYRPHFSSFPWLFRAGLASSALPPPSCFQLARITCFFFFFYRLSLFFLLRLYRHPAYEVVVHYRHLLPSFFILKLTANADFNVTVNSLKIPFNVYVCARYHCLKITTMFLTKVKKTVVSYVLLHPKVKVHTSTVLH